MLAVLGQATNPAEVLRPYPEVLEEEIWAPFARERNVSWDWFWPGWETALIELAADGTIARERLLDETVAALGQHTDAGTFKALATFHDKQIKPSAAELAAREGSYPRLLESDRDATIGFTLAVLLRLDRSTRSTAARCSSASTPP